ncbi:MAG: nitroreductase family protein [Acidobacteriota bacterium]|jgi:nitroreductase
MRKETLGLLLVVVLFGFPCGLAAQEQAGQDVLQLPAPQREGGIPLMQALSARHSSREFSDKPLPPQVLSDLLWAAFGINRPDKGGRTAPSPYNRQEIHIYVTRADGFFVYEPKPHVLRRLGTEDVRALTGTQAYVGKTPVNLVYVADVSNIPDSDAPLNLIFLGASTGTIAQNVYLFCASTGLSTVVRGLIDRDRLAQALRLGDNQRVTLAQSVGYPE